MVVCLNELITQEREVRQMNNIDRLKKCGFTAFRQERTRTLVVEKWPRVFTKAQRKSSVYVTDKKLNKSWKMPPMTDTELVDKLCK